MSMPKGTWTVDDIEAFPDDGNRYEIIDGELLVTPSPVVFHQRTLGALHALLRPYAKVLSLEVFVAPMDVRVSSNTQVEPDLLVVPWLGDADRSTRWIAMNRLVLAAEILSPSTRRIDRDAKRRLYLGQGVREYWTIDIDARAIEVWAGDSSSPRVVREMLSWQPLPQAESLRLDVCALFNEVSPIA